MWAGRPPLRKMWAGRPHSYCGQWLKQATHLPIDPHKTAAVRDALLPFSLSTFLKKAPPVPFKGEFLSLLCLRWALPC
jgi:hypothetical protein